MPWHAAGIALGSAGASALSAAAPRLLRIVASNGGAAAMTRPLGPGAPAPWSWGPSQLQHQAQRTHKTDAAASAEGEREDPVTRVRKSIKVGRAALRAGATAVRHARHPPWARPLLHVHAGPRMAPHAHEDRIMHARVPACNRFDRGPCKALHAAAAVRCPPPAGRPLASLLRQLATCVAVRAPTCLPPPPNRGLNAPLALPPPQHPPPGRAGPASPGAGR